jgi:uncharacterized protein (TIGR00661 family)
MSDYANKRVLVAPLNWGLGHVTRSIPVIRQLLELGCTVILASDGEAKAMLEHEFPELVCLDLPSYQVTYPAQNMVWGMAKQTPRILRAIWKEQIKVQQIIEKERITHLISDNRYGCRSSRVPSVFITHQLHLRTPHSLVTWFANKMMRYLVRPFDQVWVPDSASLTQNLSGELSHGKIWHKSVHFIGPLSRMWPAEAPPKYDLIMVLSGPEPQRTYLESELLGQALNLHLKCLVVRGKPLENTHYFTANHVEVVSFLTSEALNRAINESTYVVCRSGYSSIMDLAALGKRALLIPTPGQTEQEYLAKNLSEAKILPFQTQGKVDLAAGIEAMTNHHGLLEFVDRANCLTELANWLSLPHEFK